RKACDLASGNSRRGRPSAPSPALPLRRGLPVVLALEALDATRGVHELLLTREERMALRAYLDSDLGPRRAGVDNLTAIAGDRRINVLGMNASLHGPPPGQRLHASSAYRRTQEIDDSLANRQTNSPLPRRAGNPREGSGRNLNGRARTAASPAGSSGSGNPCWSWSA